MTSAPGWLADNLPRVLAEDPFLRRFLRVFEEIAVKVRTEANGQEHYVDPGVAPPEMVRWLGTWVDQDVPGSWDEEHQRRFVKQAGPLFRYRGTRPAVQLALEAITRAPVEIRDPAEIRRGTKEPRAVVPRPVKIKLSGRGGMKPLALVRLVGSYLPAQVNFDLTIDVPDDGYPARTFKVRGVEVYDEQDRLLSKQQPGWEDDD